MSKIELAYKSSAVGEEDRNALVMQELSQVYYIATRIRERLPDQVELDDLVNAGVIGLIEASRSFDNSKNNQFRTFAKFRIRGAIMDSLRELDWGSRSLRRRAREITEARAVLESKLHRAPTELEISVEMGLELAHLQKILAQVNGLHVSGQKTAASNDQSELFDVIEMAPSQDEDALSVFLKGERKAHLADAISKLNEREQLILSLYYREELTMKEIAEIVGVALSRVAQILQASIKKLKGMLAHLEEQSMPTYERNGGRHERVQVSGY